MENQTIIKSLSTRLEALNYRQGQLINKIRITPAGVRLSELYELEIGSIAIEIASITDHIQFLSMQTVKKG